jgi:hypothetical protein
VPEPNEITPATVDGATELATLKRVHGEILTKRQKDKARIAELEIAAIALQEKTTKAEAAAHDALIGAPLRRMAETVSDVPALFLSEFAKHYTIEADQDGRIAVTTLDGNAAIDRNGKPVEFTPHSLYSLLASQAVVAGGTKDERSKTFTVLMRYFGASGAAGTSQRTSETRSAKVPSIQFGLR